MALSGTEVNRIKTKWQRFVAEFVAFPAITFTDGDIPAAGAITWKPFCLISPRFAYTSGASVTLDATDSYYRPTTAASTVTFSKASGTGTVTDNGDKTCTVSGASGNVVVEAVATNGSETHTAYANVYGGASGNFKAVVSRVDGLSGSFDNGEWKADLVLRGDYSSYLTNDGRDQPILMHVTHYWDGVSDTFGGYVHHNNTFVLICRESDIHVKHSGEYETILHLETPAYALKQRTLPEMIFNTSAAAGKYSAATLSPTDISYFLLKYGTNLADYFNISLWDNASGIPSGEDLIIHDKADLWSAVRDLCGYSFGIAYFDRWSHLLVKPDPRARLTEFQNITSSVYDAVNPLTSAHMLEYTIKRLRTDITQEVSAQAKLPGGDIIDGSAGQSGDLGGNIFLPGGYLAPDQATLESWLGEWWAYLNSEYRIEFTLPMGHELNPGDEFSIGALDPPIGETLAADTWYVSDINYEFDFTRGFWTRRINAFRTETPPS